MPDTDFLFDERIYRTLTVNRAKTDPSTLFIVPGVTQMTYAGSYYESPAAALQSGINKEEELTSPGVKYDNNSGIISTIRASAQNRAKAIIEANNKNAKYYNAPLSFIHPYALLRLNSTQTTDPSSGIVTTSVIIDKAGEQKLYE